MDALGFLFFCGIFPFVVDAMIPSSGPCVIAPPSFLQRNASDNETNFYANMKCPIGLVNWQYPTHEVYIHYEKAYNDTDFRVCLMNMGGANRLTFFDVSEDLNKPKRGFKIPRSARASRRKTAKAGAPSKPRKPHCIQSLKRKAVLKARAPKKHLYMAAFLYRIVPNK